jgi:hypothetical protein
MLLLAVLAAMMLVVSPVFAHPGGDTTHGHKYYKNYYPNDYYNYCHPDGDNYYGDAQAQEWCSQWYNGYTTKWYQGEKYYYVHVYYEWYNQADDNWYNQDYWYYCQYHKYDDPNSNQPYFKAWVGYEPTGDHYWESFYWSSGGPQQ